MKGKRGYPRFASAAMTTLLAILAMTTGCIHTYPTADPDDPTLLRASLSVDLRLDLSPMEIKRAQTVDSATRDSQWALCRLIAQLKSASGESRQANTYLYHDINSTEPVSVALPWKLPTKSHTLYLWADYLAPKDSSEIYFHASDLLNITLLPDPVAGKIFPLPPLRCGAISTTVNPAEYETTADGKIHIPLTVETPLASIKIVADDVEAFIRRYPAVTYNPAEYSVELTFSSPFPASFNLPSGEPSRYLSPYSSASLLFIPDASASTLINLPLFPASSGESLTADITVYNSARSIISRTRNVSIPAQRGRTSVVRGNFLTNYLSAPLTVNNEWEDEIIIDITDTRK